MLSRFEHFIYDLEEIDLYWHRISSEVMSSYGLKGTQAIYFIKLKDCPEGLTSAQFSSMCSKDKADVSRDLKKLEESGLVKRLSQGENNYRAPIILTEKGRELTKKISEKANAAVDCIGRNMTEEERVIFYKALDSIAANMKELSKKGIE